MKTVILCGGQGNRLREETETRPKPMVPIGGRPILWHIMQLYAHFDYSEFVLCLGYRSEVIKEYFLNYEAMNSDFTVGIGKRHGIEYHGGTASQDLRITLAETGADTMTGGRVARIKRYIDDETFFLTYGDGVSDLDLRALLEFHQAHGKIATVTAVRPSSRFGTLWFDARGRVETFVEKPVQDNWASAGFFVLNREIFDYLGGDDCVFEQEPLERLAADGQLIAYPHEGFFFAMDTYREYLHLNDLWNKGVAPWKVWG